jgi:hypothetical protein
MSFPPGHHALRSRIAERIDRLVDEQGARAVGRLLGVSGTTISRGRPELRDWMLVEGLTLAVSDLDLRDAMIAYLLGDDRQPVAGDATAVTADAWADIKTSATVQGAIAEALQNGRLADAEKVAIHRALLERQRADQKLIADLEAS